MGYHLLGKGRKTSVVRDETANETIDDVNKSSAKKEEGGDE